MLIPIGLKRAKLAVTFIQICTHGDKERIAQVHPVHLLQ